MNNNFEAVAEIDRLRAENARLKEALVKLVGDIDALVNDSDGVAGLHLNGDVARWDELLAGGRFEEWLMSLEAARSLLPGEPR